MSDVIKELRSLKVRAPEHLADAVLRRVGIGDEYAQIETAIGPIFVAYNANGLSSLEPAEDPATFEENFRRRIGREVTRAAEPAPIVERTRRFLMGSGTRPKVDLRGVGRFGREVLEAAARIPRGEVRPYSWIARQIGKPKAVRAVGTALGKNPVPFVIPCHRVVRGEGGVGNYGFGSPMKRALLASEGIDMEEFDELARRGLRLTGSDTTKIFCFPSCRDARRVTEKHRVMFHDETEARSAGYRPCKHCLPAIAS